MAAPANPNNRTSKFAKFLESYGVEALAAKLDVHSSAVYHWIRKSTAPRPRHALMIEQLARAEGLDLTIADIYEHRSYLPAVPESGPRTQRASQWI